MSAHYHLSDELLLSYAAGTLDEASSLLVATHLALCPHCRSRNLAADAVGGELLDALPPAELSPGLMESVLAQLGDRQVVRRGDLAADNEDRPHQPLVAIDDAEPLELHDGRLHCLALCGR